MTAKSKIQSSKYNFGFAILVWLVFVALSFLPKNSLTLTKYHISNSELHIITVLVYLPTLFIWLALLYAFSSFKNYSEQIRGSSESSGYKYIAYALGISLISFVVSSFMSLFRQLALNSSHNSLTDTNNFIIVTNYLSVLGAVLSYWYFFKGGHSLIKTLKNKFKYSKSDNLVVLSMIVVAVIYMILIFKNPYRRAAIDASTGPTYALPDSLIVLTVALPYIISWLFGMFSISRIYSYSVNVKGIVYRLIFKRLATSIGVVIVLTITLQLVTQLSGYFSKLGLNSILGIIVVIYLVLIYAYTMVAKAAKQLNEIELLGKDT